VNGGDVAFLLIFRYITGTPSGVFILLEPRHKDGTRHANQQIRNLVM